MHPDTIRFYDISTSTYATSGAVFYDDIDAVSWCFYEDLPPKKENWLLLTDEDVKL